MISIETSPDWNHRFRVTLFRDGVWLENSPSADWLHQIITHHWNLIESSKDHPRHQPRVIGLRRGCGIVETLGGGDAPDVEDASVFTSQADQPIAVLLPPD